MGSAAHKLGFNDVTAHPARWSDCLAATSAEEHDNALRYDHPMFSVPMTSAEFIEAIG